MSKPDAARMTNLTPPDGTTLFLIGMKVTKPWRIRAWTYTFFAMPRMLKHLERHREAGLLSYHLYLVPSPLVVTYWRSAADIQAFAADSAAPHRPAWQWFNKHFADQNAVGIWHETYEIDRHETINSGMPPWGLSKAVGRRPIAAGSRTAAQRMAASGVNAPGRAPAAS
ncbi:MULTISPECIES: DUF4188 domain-containing protein [unclassified Gordonia (in: high G+C Gram-positive bacteria)]|uniref:DUF4188 domain-containing protein n=1 Tax=unclassified Gordonia (in: high G+C Gram-positive bacteria) TaxID=2657482 RepID=UPI001F0D45A6|nr:DUF4188 domain-containing protein [Gordonia sp. ABSL49_1]MCH5644928.1 DUF4188 domain-containing protein [Gordonia sp. ABSL49_1]